DVTRSIYLQILHSVPTRRSSDLPRSIRTSIHSQSCAMVIPSYAMSSRACFGAQETRCTIGHKCFSSYNPSVSRTASQSATPPARSEEHTSELQSRENLVCRLLLE